MKKLIIDSNIDIEFEIKNLKSITIELNQKEYEEYLLWKKRKSKKSRK
jgi:hypothetical protein